MDWIKRIKALFVNRRESKKMKMERVLKAAEEGDLLLIKSIIKDESDIEQFGHECLMAACKSDHDVIVDYLIQRGVDINETSDGYSALHKCVDYSSPKCAKLLVDNGARLDVMCNWGTPLELACRRRRELIMEIIFQSPSCTRAAKIVALEHMGAMSVEIRDFQSARRHWSRSLQERRLAEPGDLDEAKSQLTHPVYGNQFHTEEDLDRIVSSEKDMWMQALIIMERIMGHHNPNDYYRFVEKACNRLVDRYHEEEAVYRR